MACELYLEKAVIKKHSPTPPHHARIYNCHTRRRDSAWLTAKGLCICIAPYSLYGAFTNLIQWFLAYELTRDIGMRKTVIVPVRELVFPRPRSKWHGGDSTWGSNPGMRYLPRCSGLSGGETLGFTNVWMFSGLPWAQMVKRQCQEKERNGPLKGNSKYAVSIKV